MGDFLHIAFWVVCAFVWGIAYGRMKSQEVEDKLRIQISNLTEANRILRKRIEAD